MSCGLIPGPGAVCAFGLQSILASVGFSLGTPVFLLHLKLTRFVHPSMPPPRSWEAAHEYYSLSTDRMSYEFQAPYHRLLDFPLQSASEGILHILLLPQFHLSKQSTPLAFIDHMDLLVPGKIGLLKCAVTFMIFFIFHGHVFS